MSSLSAATKFAFVIGDPVSSSLSPVMHNAGYRALNLQNEFVFLAARVEAARLPDAIKGLRALGAVGASVTMPHKRGVMALLDDLHETARAIGAVNTIVNSGGRLIGHNTDAAGVVEPLKRLSALKGKRVRLIGAGGAARAACYGLKREGALVTIYNRTLGAAQELAKEFSFDAAPLVDADAGSDFDILINASPVGMKPNQDERPIAGGNIRQEHMIFDMVYQPHETSLLKAARGAGARLVHGIEMFLHQGAEQFRLYTGQAPPLEALRAALADHLKIK